MCTYYTCIYTIHTPLNTSKHPLNALYTPYTHNCRYLQQLLKKHGPNNLDALVYLASTLALFTVSCYCLHVYPSWWSVIMCGGVVTRGFIIFHDCCHNSFFPSSKDNALCAKVLAAFVCQNAADWTKVCLLHISVYIITMFSVKFSLY